MPYSDLDDAPSTPTPYFVVTERRWNTLAECMSELAAKFPTAGAGEVVIGSDSGRYRVLEMEQGDLLTVRNGQVVRLDGTKETGSSVVVSGGYPVWRSEFLRRLRHYLIYGD